MPSPCAGNLDITPDDPRWIGAWWGGFLLCGALLFFSSLLMFGFPQSLPPHADPTLESEQAMLPEREDDRPKPSNGVLRHPLEPDSSASCFQQLRGKVARDGQGGLRLGARCAGMAAWRGLSPQLIVQAAWGNGTCADHPWPSSGQREPCPVIDMDVCGAEHGGQAGGWPCTASRSSGGLWAGTPI